MKIVSRNIKAMVLYLFLAFGVLWHITGLFARVMEWSAGWLIIMLGIWIGMEYHSFYLKEKNGASNRKKQTFLWWGVAIVVLTWWIEWFGVNTGMIFGRYTYGDVLQPQILGVPVAIGFAWFTMLLSALALQDHFLSGFGGGGDYSRSLRTALLMVIFDAIMEPVAEKLTYWQWINSGIPWQNYLAWFVFGSLLTFGSLRQDFLPKQHPTIAFHFYLAQLLYFGLVSLAL